MSQSQSRYPIHRKAQNKYPIFLCVFYRISGCLCHMTRTVIFLLKNFSEYNDDLGDELLFSVNLFQSLKTERDIPGVVFFPLRSSRRSRKWNSNANFSSVKDGKGPHIKVHRTTKMALELDNTLAKIPFNSERERNFKPLASQRTACSGSLNRNNHCFDLTGGILLVVECWASLERTRRALNNRWIAEKDNALWGQSRQADSEGNWGRGASRVRNSLRSHLTKRSGKCDWWIQLWIHGEFPWYPRQIRRKWSAILVSNVAQISW